MLSAFGVEHGEISKGKWIRPMRGTPGGRRPTAAQQRTQGTDPNFVSRPQKIKNAATRAVEAPISIKGIGESAGGGLRKVGGFFERRPGLTGTALVGGGGAAGYHYLNQKEPRKKKS